MSIDVQQIRAAADAPSEHPELLGDNVVVSRAWLRAVADRIEGDGRKISDLMGRILSPASRVLRSGR